MELIAEARNFKVMKSEVLKQKKIVVIVNGSFNISDFHEVWKEVRGMSHKSKIKFLHHKQVTNENSIF